MYNQLHPLILASGSPRRKELLHSLGFKFEVHSSDVDEEYESASPDKLASVISRRKAEAVKEKFPDFFIIAADTEVWFEGKRFGKPASLQDAERMLSLLQNNVHEVWGGISIYSPLTKQFITETSCTKVHFVEMNSESIQAYVRAEEVLDKAGAYAAQGFGASIIRKIDGSYSNVVGLDLALLINLFKKTALVK